MSNVKNVEALARLVGFCTGLGGQYNPGHQNLQLANLQTLLHKAQEALRKVSTAKTAHENATNQREVLYAQVRDRVTRILGELHAAGALPQTIADANTMARKIQGRIVAEPESEEPAEQGKQPIKRRARGADFISITHHFEKLLETLTAEPVYQPTAGVLSLAQLQALLVSMREANQAVMEAAVVLQTVRNKRNEVFYGKNGSLYTIARQVKHQVKALFGFESEVFKDVRSISFTKPDL